MGRGGDGRRRDAAAAKRKQRAGTAAYSHATIGGAGAGLAAVVAAVIYIARPRDHITHVVVEAGDGVTTPQPGDTVAVHYIGRVAETGAIFDSSALRRAPVEFVVGRRQALKGLEKAVPRMSLGERARLHVSSEWAFGAAGMQDDAFPDQYTVPPHAAVEFDVTLLAVNGQLRNISFIETYDGALPPTVVDAAAKARRRLFLAFTDTAARPDAVAAMREFLAPLQREFAADLIFLIHDANQTLPTNLGFTAEECAGHRAFAVAETAYGRPEEVKSWSTPKWRYPAADAAPTLDELREWIGRWKAGGVPRHVLSEPAGESWAPGKVATVVGSTFADIVLDPAKDVFIFFSAPWCGHCRMLTPKFDDLAGRFAADAGVVIARIDLTQNRPPMDRRAFNVTGFPTLYLAPAAPAGTDDNVMPAVAPDAPREYLGERETEAMEQWVHQYRKTPRPLPEGWRQLRSQDGPRKGLPYYHNPATGETVWHIPSQPSEP